MRVWSVAVLALLVCSAGAMRTKLSMQSRNLIAEVGDAANKVFTAYPCPTGAKNFTECYATTTSAVDYTWGAPEIRYPTDGSPWGVHLTGPYPDGRSYLVSWYTGGPTIGLNPVRPSTAGLKAYASVTPQVNGGAPSTFEGSIINYYRLFTDAKYVNFSYVSPYIHHVVLSNLLPNTKYTYKVSCRNDSLVGSYSFTTLPVSDGASSPYPLRIGLMGDVGQTRNSSLTRDQLIENKPQVVLHVGDSSYADNYGASGPNNSSGGGTNQQRWDSHAVLWEPLLSTVPMLNLPGNHETETSGIKASIGLTTTSWSFPTNFPFQSFAARFPSPGATAATPFGNITATMYYSTVLGGVATLISLNNYIAFQPGSNQHKWALSELAKVDRTKTPWLIVQFHTSVYHTYVNHYKEMECFRSIWEPIFYKYGVDVVVNGHVHAYERTHPIYNYTRNNCGPIYVTVGDGGNIEGLYKQYVDGISTTTKKTYCESMTNGGLTPVQIYYTKPSGWNSAGPRPTNCPTVSFQPASGVAGGPPVVTLNGTQPLLGFCQSSQPVWSAHRDASFGHAILELQSPTTARFMWFKNLMGTKVVVDDVMLERVSGCPSRRRRGTL